MADILPFPTDQHPISLTLEPLEWLAIILKIAGRGHDDVLARIAEGKMLSQLKDAR